MPFSLSGIDMIYDHLPVDEWLSKSGTGGVRLTVPQSMLEIKIIQPQSTSPEPQTLKTKFTNVSFNKPSGGFGNIKFERQGVAL